MNWDSVDFDWNQARAVLAVLKEGSLSAAARSMGQTQPTLGRQIAAIEDQLGVALFERTGRSVTPTPTALDLIEPLDKMYQAANAVSLTASGHTETIEGLVRITASEMFATYILPDILAPLMRTQPGIKIDIVAADDVRNLQMREADIAIRHVRPEEPSLIARLVAEQGASLYASQGYIEGFGLPETVADLANHHLIGVGNESDTLGFYREWGWPVGAEHIRYASTSGVAAWALAERGLGMTVMSDWIAEKSPNMRRVLAGDEPLVRFPTWLVSHRDLVTSRRIRLVFDHLVKGFSQI